MYRSALGLSLALFLLAPVASYSEASNRYEFKAPKRAKFALTIPSSMVVENQEKQNGVLKLTIVPTEGDVFKILLSAAKVTNAGDPEESAKLAQYLVLTRGNQLLDTSVETDLKMMELTGVHGTGYLYTLTDSREELPPGEFRYLCQGIMVVGNLQLGATLLTDSPDEEVVIPFFEILRLVEPL